jgi:hypothetical protein
MEVSFLENLRLPWQRYSINHPAAAWRSLPLEFHLLLSVEQNMSKTHFNWIDVGLQFFC